MYAAPTAGRMLRDFGARVIKVEDPKAGDFARQWTPQHEGMSIGFARLNSGKESIGIDLRRPEGRDLVRRLAATVDVVVESFRPGRLEDWGLGYDVLSARQPRSRADPGVRLRADRPVPGAARLRHGRRDRQRLRVRQRLAGLAADLAAVRLRRLHRRAVGGLRDDDGAVQPRPAPAGATSSTWRSTSR